MSLKINKDGRFWYNDEGKLHKDNGPAAEWSDGTKEWFLNGKIHRKDGPAIEYSNGYKAWYLNGERLTEENYHVLKNR